MLNSVGERTAAVWNVSFKLTLSGCVVFIMLCRPCIP